MTVLVRRQSRGVWREGSEERAGYARDPSALCEPGEGCTDLLGAGSEGPHGDSVLRTQESGAWAGAWVGDPWLPFQTPLHQQANTSASAPLIPHCPFPPPIQGGPEAKASVGLGRERGVEQSLEILLSSQAPARGAFPSSWWRDTSLDLALSPSPAVEA